MCKTEYTEGGAKHHPLPKIGLNKKLVMIWNSDARSLQILTQGPILVYLHEVDASRVFLVLR